MSDTSHTLRVALIGDYDPSAIAHQAIPEALRLSGESFGHAIQDVWVHTASISDPESQFRDFDGIWCVPATPYANMEGAIETIRYARESGRPFLGTCGGFQHALIEYARNVCGLRTADHAETNPDGACLVIAPLECSLVEKSGEILLEPGTKIHDAYGIDRITEGYHCSYGVNRDFEPKLFGGALRVTARDPAGQVRAVELAGHPFFIATLFQSERRALRGEVPPLMRSFAEAMATGRTENRPFSPTRSGRF
jgi:CTP synthase (UTP-ammonia lyase)